jgi:hypothetical protein
VNQAQDIDRDETTPALDVEHALDVLPMIHRHHDGGIAFVHKVDGGLKQLWYVTPDELQGMLRPVAEFLAKNSYFSMNALHRHGPYRDKATGLWAIGVDKFRNKGERRFGRVTENMRYLNACFCDIDCGRSEAEAKNALEKMTVREVQRRVEDLQDAGAIPPFSIMGHSGRGLYVLWLLRDDRPGLEKQSAPAFNWHIPLWKALQTAIENILIHAQLPVDAQGKLITQVYRVPGSIHGGTGKRVHYWVYMQGDEKRIITYTLQELAGLLHLPSTSGDLPNETLQQAQEPAYKRAEKPCPAKAAGWRQRHALLAEDMLTIESARGGYRKRNTEYPDGHRSPKYGRWKLLTVFAQALVRSMYSPKELRPPNAIDPEARRDILERLQTMARQCIPPYPSDNTDTTPEAILDAVIAEHTPGPDGRQALSKTPSNETLLLALGITADMARKLNLKTIRPPDVAAEARAKLPLQRDLVQARRAFARKYIEAHGSISARALARLYKAAGYTGANQQTANQDLLSILGPDRYHKGGRARKAAL